MKNRGQTVREILKVLGEVNRLLRDHGVTMERKPGVKSTASSLEVVNYQNGPMVEAYVEAAMNDGTALCWSLDVTWNDDLFRIRGVLERNTRAGAETLEQLPNREVGDLDEFPEALTSMTRALLALDSR